MIRDVLLIRNVPLIIESHTFMIDDAYKSIIMDFL
ncbi:hypothetical protein VA7868_01482 [Vibrio aerogenes CECT 7868]|uniref:Uncharacterized protein n=1 Tax=Vibrio aerogenes CECT 7868 TaxID=1216006 RepID=A0A1M5Y4S2_9VIBR|nr:hypothetical protein VA7868_01482 [Vibrio aerogenes CECT 7868]